MREELAHQHQAELRHITWKVPGLVWSLDDAELARVAHHNWHLHQVQDLASRYKFTPWVGEHILGETVAVHLEQLFLLAHEQNHRSRDCLDGHIAYRVFQDAKPALKAYTLRKQREIFDRVNELTKTLKRVVVRKLWEGHKNPHPTSTKLVR